MWQFETHIGRIIGWQIALATVCVAICVVLDLTAVSANQGVSSALAAGSVLIPSAWYAWVNQRTFNATRLLLFGVVRMLLTVAGMVVSIVIIGIEPVGFFVTLVVVQCGYWAK